MRPGETLGQLIERAGGLMPEAYLFGSEFLRESTRKEQQRRLDELTRDLEREVEQTGSALLGGATTPQDTAALTTRMETERRMVDAFRTTQATGRIVLRLDPAGSDVSKLMGLVLEGGDRFVVPPRPATVNVLGSVYNPNSFIHEANLRVADYLRQAGGCTRNADKGRIFIIRADGSVVPRAGVEQPVYKGVRRDAAKSRGFAGDSSTDVQDAVSARVEGLVAGLRPTGAGCGGDQYSAVGL
ncbi:MAG: SLBB domain-containing protein [Paludibaculum sp.]